MNAGDDVEQLAIPFQEKLTDIAEATDGITKNVRNVVARRNFCFWNFIIKPPFRKVKLNGRNNQVASNLRRLRHDKGLSQEDLAHEAGVNRTYMSKLEKGGSYVGLEIIEKLAKTLDAPPADFLKLPVKKRAKRD